MVKVCRGCSSSIRTPPCKPISNKFLTLPTAKTLISMFLHLYMCDILLVISVSYLYPCK